MVSYESFIKADYSQEYPVILMPEAEFFLAHLPHAQPKILTAKKYFHHHMNFAFLRQILKRMSVSLRLIFTDPFRK